MQLVTSTQRAKTAAERWRYCYYRRHWISVLGDDSAAIHRQLVALGESPTPEQVNKIIGNTSWTDLYCDACRKQVTEAVHFTTSEASIELCRACVAVAVALLPTR